MYVTEEEKKKAKKAFLALMQDPNIQLPKRGGKDFLASLQQLYMFFCKELSFLTKQDQVMIEEICQSILEIASLTNQTLAYEKFCKVMEKMSKYIHIIKDCLPVDGYGISNRNLFRIRNESENRVFSRQEIFHQPIYQYKNIKAYRYNVKDNPSLYLSSTVHCSLKELGSSMNNHLIGSLYRLDDEREDALYVLEFGVRPIDFIRSKKHFVNGYTYRNYLFTYPLLAACSFVATRKDSDTIPEYCISNLLLRWLVDNHDDKLCGIRYFSCYNATYIIEDKRECRKEIDTNASFTKLFMNYVFPIEKDARKTDSYSTKLVRNFLINKPKLSCDCIDIRDFEKNIKTDNRSLKKINIKQKVS